MMRERTVRHHVEILWRMRDRAFVCTEKRANGTK